MISITSLDQTGLSVRQDWRSWEQFGKVVKPQLAGRPKKYMQMCINQALAVDESAISRAPKWNRKKVDCIAKQPHQILPNDWMTRLTGWKAHQ